MTEKKNEYKKKYKDQKKKCAELEEKLKKQSEDFESFKEKAKTNYSSNDDKKIQKFMDKIEKLEDKNSQL